MRILAIRGENLASLAGPFALELADAPLVGAGLFAITGPTGAGKSTILDALCLALFNDMPRLPSGNAVFGRDDDPDPLTISDRRGILRRGAASGWAEVAFEGIDGQAYRSRWTVRRARDKADGKLQAVKMELARLSDGEVLADRTAEVLAEVERLLGLNFAQFRRTVLLAQGDFAGFLKAKGNERAEILARLTGTGIYAAISRLAFERSKAERASLDELDRRLAEVALPTPEQEQALADELASGTAEVVALEARGQALSVAAAWHRRAAELRSLVSVQETALAGAAAQVEALTPDREALARYDELLPLLAPLGELRRAEQALLAARAQAGQAAAAVTEAGARVETAALREAEAQRGLAGSEAAEATLAPTLVKARALDVRIAGARETVETAAGEAARLERDAQSAADGLAAQKSMLETEQAQADRTRAWLAEHAGREGLATGWPRWSALLEEAARTAKSLRAAKGGLAAAEEDRQAANAPIFALRESEKQAADVLARTRGAVEASRTDADPVAATAAREAAAGTLDGLRQALTASRSLAAILDTLAEVEAALATLDRAAEARAARLPILETELAGLRGEVRGLRRVLDAYAIAEGKEAAALRATLDPGAPCPVCGGTDHPFRDPHALVDERRVALDADRDRLESAIAILVGEQGRLQAEAAAEADSRARLTRSRTTAQADRDGALATLGSLTPDLPADRTLADRLAEPIARAEAAHQAALAAEREAQRAAKAQADALAALAMANTAHGAAVAALTQAETALAKTEARLAQARADHDRLAAEAATQAAALADGLAPVDGWRDRLAQDPAGLVAELAAWVDRWRQSKDRLAELTASLARRQATVEERAQALSALHAQAKVAADRLALAESALAGLVAERRALLGDDEPDALEARARAAVDAARQSLASTQRDLTAAREALAAAEGNRVAAVKATQIAETTLATAQQEFARQLSPTGSSRAEVEAVLGRGQDWAVATRTRLVEAQRRQAEQASILADRKRQCDMHLAENPPTEDEQTVAAALAASQRDLGLARERVQEARSLAQRHGEAKAAHAGLGRRREAQAAKVQLWGSLNEVIGSAGGTKFQNYAQALSLDVLLAEANHHLADLAPRYRLERTRAGNEPASLEIQVVDRDLGGEVRSVHSLSGGESFLVSLALALGLSGMVGGGARIGTLFIDEGFGALDPGSLDLAISCLETLQASGRQVGVISHVEALNERLGVQVVVEKAGGGRSTLRIREALGLAA